jgi:hypothetical protein
MVPAASRRTRGRSSQRDWSRQTIRPLGFHACYEKGPGLSRNGLPDCLAEMNYSTRQILDAIEEAAIEENTIVIISPPNGEPERIADEGAR